MVKANEDKLQLSYTLFCDDVRLEVGNKLSLMGVFHQILVQHFPVTVMKFAVVSQWRGEGRHLSEVRILTADRQQAVVLAEPSPFEVTRGGVANNISFFFNVEFPAPGNYRVQTLLDSTLADEQELTLILADANGSPAPDAMSEAVN
ncbi:MAG: hypothetical protein QOJ70_2470 [Acidobacteriota bacterium]|jgi:hypothetical protein|nr:hypothetical protein [Acidobacteriota bacterium]MDT7808657.1 hypothetical protein [Acidobacteriota bacterium]